MRRTSGLIELEVLGVHAQAERVEAVVPGRLPSRCLGGAEPGSQSGRDAEARATTACTLCAACRLLSHAVTRNHSTHNLLERADRVDSGLRMDDSLAPNSVLVAQENQCVHPLHCRLVCVLFVHQLSASSLTRIE